VKTSITKKNGTAKIITPTIRISATNKLIANKINANSNDTNQFFKNKFQPEFTACQNLSPFITTKAIIYLTIKEITIMKGIKIK